MYGCVMTTKTTTTVVGVRGPPSWGRIKAVIERERAALIGQHQLEAGQPSELARAAAAAADDNRGAQLSGASRRQRAVRARTRDGRPDRPRPLIKIKTRGATAEVPADYWPQLRSDRFGGRRAGARRLN
jgi:hypothetical protein